MDVIQYILCMLCRESVTKLSCVKELQFSKIIVFGYSVWVLIKEGNMYIDRIPKLQLLSESIISKCKSKE